MVCRTCGHSGEEHEWSDPQVCKSLHCPCFKYEDTTDIQVVISDVQKYIMKITTLKEQMRYVLNNIRYFRNLTNKDLVLHWWKFFNGWNFNKYVLDSVMWKRLDDPESITRVRRKLVEENHDKYGPFDPTVEEQKQYKQLGIMEWVVMSKL